MQREHSLPGENWKLKVLLCPCKETFQVRLANPPNRVDVGCQNVRGKHTIGFNTLYAIEEAENRPEEQSYLVKYPRKLRTISTSKLDPRRASEQAHAHLSSTFALPSTSSPPVRPRTHGRSCAKKYAITIRKRAWIFCNARFSASLPPCMRKRGRLPVTTWNSVRSDVTMLSMFKSVW